MGSVQGSVHCAGLLAVVAVAEMCEEIYCRIGSVSFVAEPANFTPLYFFLVLRGALESSLES